MTDSKPLSNTDYQPFTFPVETDVEGKGRPLIGSWNGQKAMIPDINHMFQEAVSAFQNVIKTTFTDEYERTVAEIQSSQKLTDEQKETYLEEIKAQYNDVAKIFIVRNFHLADKLHGLDDEPLSVLQTAAHKIPYAPIRNRVHWSLSHDQSGTLRSQEKGVAYISPNLEIFVPNKQN